MTHVLSDHEAATDLSDLFSPADTIEDELYAEVVRDLESMQTEAIRADLPVLAQGASHLEQEWCDLCADDEDSEPGVPAVIVKHTVETDYTATPDNGWDPTWGPAPQFDVWHLACGHTVAVPC